MITLQVTNRTKLYFQLEPDTYPNKGGFYCRVYKDPDGEKLFAEFCIRRDTLTGGDKMKIANKIAVAKIKMLYTTI